MVSLGGCTASFVSPQGLVVTNHHCARGSVQYNSTAENNYLENGFLAETKGADGAARMEAMVETDDGFVLSEKDLEIRGPGAMTGTAHDLVTGQTWEWGQANYVRLGRDTEPVHIVHVRR